MNIKEKAIYDLAESYLKTRNNDEIHTLIAVQFGLELLKHVDAKRSIVIPAIILHDVGYHKLSAHEMQKWRDDPHNKNLQKIHEREGAKIACSILEQIQYDPEWTDMICRIIECHDTGGGTANVEEQMVRDCDKLWRYTETAFRRDLVLFNRTSREHYNLLESHLNEWFFLPMSRQIAKKHLKVLKEKLATF